MAEIKKLTPLILKWEGGLSKDKRDTASSLFCPTAYRGEFYHTNKGVTYKTWVSIFGNDNDKRFFEMSSDDFNRVLRTYWNIWKADSIINQSVSNILVDWVWGSWTIGVKKVQKLIGVSADGVVGSKTITALNSVNQEKLFKDIFALREKYLNDIVKNNPSQKVYLKGWMNRLNDFKFSPAD